MSTDANLRPRRRHLFGLSLAHLLCDGYASFPAPLLSGLAASLNVSYGAVSALLGFNAVASALANIVVGLGTDRWKHLGSATVVGAAALTVLCMSTVGVMPHYGLLAVVMVVGLLGCGSFHPPGFALAGDASHPHRHRGVSIVMTAGIAACGLGPVFVSQVVRVGGLRATPWCAIPGLLLAATAAALLRGMPSGRTSATAAPVSIEERAAARTSRVWLALLFANGVLRSYAHMGVIVIVSYLVEQEWGSSVAASGLAIGALQVGAGLGGLIGAMATHTGRERRTLLWCAPLNCLVLLPMMFTTGWVWFLWLPFYGLAINGPGAVSISMAQRIAPRRSALVSGLLVGPVWAVGSFLASLTTPHLMAARGQAATMAFLLIPLALSFLAAWPLPHTHKGED